MRRKESRRGFTLIELLVVISITTGMVTQVIPAAQKAREAAAKMKCQNNLKQLAIAAHNYESVHHWFPPNVPELMKAANLSETGEIDGMKVLIPSTPSTGIVPAYTFTIDPVAPGVTGSETAYVTLTPGGGTTAVFKPTPGATQGREQMLQAVRAAGAIHVADLLSLPPSAADRQWLLDRFAESANSPAVLQNAFNALKGSDGKVSFRSMIDAKGRLLIGTDNGVYSGADYILERAMVGINGESKETLPGMTLAEIDGKAPGDVAPLGFPMLRSLTQTFLHDPAALQSQLNLLAQAEAAAKRGDVGGVKDALKNYNTQTDKLSELPLPLISPAGKHTLNAWIGDERYVYVFLGTYN